MSTDNNKWQKFKEAADLEPDAPAEQPHATQTLEDDVVKEEAPVQSQSGLEHLSHEDLEEKLTLAEKQNHEYWEKLTRLSAELDNVRRRAEKDVAAAYQYGAEKLIKGLLPVMDSFDQALLLVDKEEQSAMYDGLHLTQKLFLDTQTQHIN